MGGRDRPLDWYVGGQKIFCSCMTNGQCPQQMTSWISAKYWMFFSKSFLCQMTRLILGATTPLPAQIFLRTSFCQFCRRSSATWTKNTWKLQIPAKSHKNYFGRLTAKFQQTAISSICLGAFKRFSAMTSVFFSNLISGSEKGGEGGPHSAHKCNMAPDLWKFHCTPWSADCTLSSICANKRST